MQRKIKLKIDATLLAADEAALRKVVEVIAELEKKGFLKDGQISFDSTEEEEISNIFDKFLDN